MNRRSIRILSRSALAALTATLVAGVAYAGPSDKAHGYGLSLFGGSNECGTTSMTHSAHVLSATSFVDEFKIWELLAFWGSDSLVNNTSAGSNLFTDPAKSASCMCSSEQDNTSKGVDFANVSYMHTHGGHSVANNNSTFVMGNSSASNTCGASTSANLLLGNASGGGTLEIATFKACEGADFTVWSHGGYKAMVPSTSRTQIFNAFHGDSSCGDFVADYVADFAADSFFDGVGENWIDEAYDDNGASGSDDCPVTIIYGNSASARKNMFYNGGFLDRKLTNATKSGSSYAFIAGCFPSNGVKLPQ